MKPESLEYKLDSYTINFYSDNFRDKQSIIAAIQWCVKLPRQSLGYTTNQPKDHTITEKEVFDTPEEAMRWIEENTKNQGIKHGAL